MLTFNINFKIIQNVALFWFLSNAVFAYSNPVIIPEVSLNPKQFKLKEPNEQVQTSQIGRQTIAESPVTEITQLLAQEQSIVRLLQTSGNNTQIALSIRGFGENAAANSLILVDGFPLVNPSLLTPNVNSIPLSDIERIEITQGSQGVLWGDQAVGGVVNIITRHPNTFFAEGRVSLGSFNQLFSSLFVSDKFNNGIFLKVFALANVADNYREHNQQTDKNIAILSGLDYAKGSVNFNLQQYIDTIQLPGGLTQKQYEHHPKQAVNFKNFSHLKTDVFQFFNQHAFNEDWILETRVGHRVTVGNGFMTTSYDRNDVTNTISPHILGSIANTKIIAGYDGQINYYDFNSPRVQENAHIQQNNLFAQATIPFLQRFALIVGARSAWQKNSIQPAQDQRTNSIDRVFVTEQGITYHPLPAWQLFLRRNGNFRFPKANEQTWLPAGVDTLKPQIGISYELGGEWKTERQQTQINIYQLMLNNEIGFNPTETDSEPFGSYNNFPRTIRKGITLTEYLMITNKLAINGQLNYVDARFAEGDFPGNQIPAVPSINGNIGINYELIPPWKMKYNVLYTGTSYASQNDENIGKKISGYWLNNITIQYVKKSFNVSFEVANLFNQRYSLFTLYDSFTQQNTYYPGTGRNYLLTLTVDID